MQDKEIQLKLDPCRGQLRLNSLTAVVGDCVGALPQPIRKGYVFAGWHTLPEGEGDDGQTLVTPSTVVTEDFPLCLYAHWDTPDKAAKKAKQKKKSAMGTQKRILILLSVLALLLIPSLMLVEYIVDIYHYTDTDGITYTIKKKDGVYGLYYDGSLCDISTVGNVDYYITQFGNEIYVDPDTGELEVYAVVDVGDTEVVGSGHHVLMFKQLTYDQSSTKDLSRVLQKIEVRNEHGTMTFVRGENNRFYIEGHENTIFSEQIFAQLAVGCGYTISSQRLENPKLLEDGSGNIDLSEYGLVAEKREREVEDKSGETKTETYDYVPATYTLTTMTGTTYSVTLGDLTVSGGGYYAQYGDRQTVYILSATNIAAAVLQPIEALVTPIITYPATLNTCFDVENFSYRSGIDYEAINQEMILALTGFDLSTVSRDPETGKYSEEVLAILKDASDKLAAMGEEATAALYEPIFEKHSTLVTKFSYVSLEEREHTMLASLPYKMSTDYMAGYLPHSDNISSVLQTLYESPYSGVVKLGPSDDDLEKYGLNEPAHIFSYIYHESIKNDAGKVVQVINHQNRVEISAKTKEGVYYLYSPIYDMIVACDESKLPFLEWELIDWYDREYFLGNIAFVDKIVMEGQELDEAIVFTLDNSKSNQSGQNINSEKLEVYANGKKIDYSLMVTKPSGSQSTENSVYNFRRFFQALLSASIEDMAKLTPEEMAAFRVTPDEDCLLKMTILMDDKLGKESSAKYAVYRFYRYTERKAYMTIEVLDSPDAQSSPENGQGLFCVSYSFCNKLMADAERFLAGEEIVINSKK